jgi:hypothetical protein
MRYIECKAQYFSRPLKTKTAMSGFEGPALKTELDDGFGVPMMKGMLTPSYNCYFEQTGTEDNSPTYDGTINIPDTRANRHKIACHIRSRDLRVNDRNLEREILGQFPPGLKREQAPRPHSLIADMPDDFDGTKVVLRSGTMAIVDMDPIEDPFAKAEDAQFTEVKTIIPPASTGENEGKSDVTLTPPAVAVSAAAARAGIVAAKATEAPKGFDPKAVQERAAAAKADSTKPADAKADEAKE